MDKQNNPEESFQLTDEKGFINIGSHPDNDVILRGENIQPFHVLLDYRQVPYRLLPLSSQAEVWVNGVEIPGNDSYSIQDVDTIDIATYRMKVQPKNGHPVQLMVSDIQSISGVADIGYKIPQAEAPTLPDGSVAGLGLAGLPLAQQTESTEDEYILVSLDTNQATVHVEQTAYYTLTITNASPIVSTFHVQLLGVPEEWTSIKPANVNLNERAQAQVSIAITPPRKPTSTAGLHPIRIIVTSLNHPGRQSILTASLEINPFHDFAIGDVNPRRKRIAWRHRYGEVKMDITNKGNNSDPFLLIAQDDDNECRFNFVAMNGLRQLGQVDYAIPPGETQTIPVQVSPVKRSFIRLSSRQYPYRVSVSQPVNQSLSLFTMGTAISRPLIGIVGIILFLLIVAGTIGYMFTPRITEFTADNTVIGVGESTTLRWKVPIFTHKLSITGVETPVNTAQGSMVVFPTETVNKYTLNATTWLWTLLSLEPRTQTFTVLAVPGEPVINTFTLSNTDVLVGDEVTLRWSVDHAEKVLLTINGVTDIFEDSKDFNGERVLVIDSDTLVSLQATNALGSIVQSDYIFSRMPGIVINKFELDKGTITRGDQVTILWEVSGTGMEDGGEVTISPFDSILPLEGKMTFFPSESMEFVLTATNRQERESRIIPVGVMEPDAEPEPPKIDFFTAAPDTITGAGSVELSWSVSGLFDSIKITNGSETVAENLSAQGFRTITVSQSGTYVITASYAGLTAGSNLKITVDPALIKPTLTVTGVYPEEDLDMGDEVTVSISLTSPSKDSPPPTGDVVVSDGTASCTITLPDTACKLTFITPGDKSIKAVYMGDSNFVQVESKPYKKLEVMGNTITLTPKIVPETGPGYFSQIVSCRVRVEGTNPVRVPDGELRIRRMCDDTATYQTTCSNDIIGYHKLTAADSGFYEFTGLVVDQLGGTWTLQVTFIGDSFYNDALAEASLEVASIKSPVSITATTTDTLPGTVNQALDYTITVQDENANGVYNTPKGTVSLTATHTDSTEISCTDLALTANSDGRSSYAICTLTPTKSGSWTLVASYKVPADPLEDPWHQDENQDQGTLTINTSVSMSLSPSTPMTLVYGLTDTIMVKIIKDDDGSNINSGTLTCSTLIGTCNNCKYNTSSKDWSCSIKPTLTDELPRYEDVSFTYSSGSYVTPSTETFAFNVEKANTEITISKQPDAVYEIGDSYILATIVTNTDGGDNPVSGTVTIQLGSNTCDPTTGMASPRVTTTTQVDVPKTFNFTSSDATGQDQRFCVQFKSSNSYNASAWVSSTAFRVKTAPSFSAVSNITMNASSPVSTLTNFSVTLSNVTSFDSSLVHIVLSSDATDIVCDPGGHTTTATDLYCDYTSTSGTTVNFRIGSSASNTWTLKAVFDGDGNNLAASSDSFTITTRFKVTGLDTPSYNSGAASRILTYYAAEPTTDSPDGETMTTYVLDYFSFDNFPADYDYASHFDVQLYTVDGANYQQVESGSDCHIENDTTNGGKIYCTSVKVTNSSHTGFKFRLVPKDSSEIFCMGNPCTVVTNPESTAALTVDILENVLESMIIPYSADQVLTETPTLKAIQYRCRETDGNKFIQFKVRIPVANSLSSISDFNNDIRFTLMCDYNSDGKDYVQTFYYSSSNSTITTAWSASTKTIDVTVTANVSGGTDGDEGDMGCHGSGGYNTVDKAKIIINYELTSSTNYEKFYTIFEFNRENDSHKTYYIDSDRFFNCDSTSVSTWSP